MFILDESEPLITIHDEHAFDVVGFEPPRNVCFGQAPFHLAEAVSYRSCQLFQLYYRSTEDAIRCDRIRHQSYVAATV